MRSREAKQFVKALKEYVKDLDNRSMHEIALVNCYLKAAMLEAFMAGKSKYDPLEFETGYPPVGEK